MDMRIIVVCFVPLLLLTTPLLAQQSDRTRTIATISDITSLIKSVSFGVLPQVNVDKLDDSYLDETYLLKFANFLDYNVIGAGKSLVIEPDKIAGFIVEKINADVDHKLISDLLIAELNKGTFNPEGGARSMNSAPTVAIGGYLVTEFEYHEQDGKFVPLLELNQAKFFINSRLVAARQNGVGVLAEWNPMPEESVHHLDEMIVNGDTVSLTLPSDQDRIPFERISVTIENVGGSGINITTGQIRNPFGFWSDYTSHRNFSSTKNNFLVNGFALKKIELGAQIDGEFQSGIGFKTAVVHGRNGRTSPLFRENEDQKYDWVTRLQYSRSNFTAGISSYLGEFRLDKRTAFGVDLLVSMKNISVSGELVYQYNNAPEEVFMTLKTPVSQFRSVAGYVQFDLVLTPKLRAYGMYDVWTFNTKDGSNRHDSIKVFHGLRYYINKNVKWTLFEFGHIDTLKFDNGDTHLSTQLEVTF